MLDLGGHSTSLPTRVDIESTLRLWEFDMKAEIRHIIDSSKQISLAVDQWTLSGSGRSFLAVSLHYLDEQRSTQSRLLAARRVTNDAEDEDARKLLHQVRLHRALRFVYGKRTC